MHFKENVPMKAKDHSDKMWGLFCKQIVLSANSDNQNKMLVSKIIEKFDEVQAVEDLVQKALTYGVPIEKHGNSATFKEKVN